VNRAPDFYILFSGSSASVRQKMSNKIAICLKYDGMFSDALLTNLLLRLTEKKIKSVNI